MRPFRKKIEWLITLKYTLQESGGNTWTGVIWFGVVVVVNTVMSLWDQ